MAQHLRKPDWLKIRLGGNEQFTKTKSIVESHCLHTICTSGKCPNMGECWSRGTATFMIGGEICTRSCRFCNTLTGKPLPLDPKEPANVAEKYDPYDQRGESSNDCGSLNPGFSRTIGSG